MFGLIDLLWILFIFSVLWAVIYFSYWVGCHVRISRGKKSERLLKIKKMQDCRHKYRIVEYCEGCGDVIEVRFLEGEEIET